VSALLDSLAEGFERVAPGLDDAAARRALLADNRRLELPTPRSERWRYTPLRALAARRFRPAEAGDRTLVDAATLAAIPAPRLVFVNGQFDAALSQCDALPAGVRLEAIDGIAPVATAEPPRADDAFVRLNAAFATGGARLVVAAETAIATPVNWVFVGAPADADLAVHARHAVELGAGAHATLVEHHLAAGAHRHLANHVVAVNLDERAELLHVRVQDEDAGAQLFAHTDATLAADAHYRRVDLELGAGLSRHELDVALRGPRARLHSGGVLAATQRRHLDTRLSIVHAARDTACDLLWRGAAAGRARAAFHGGIRIDAGADGAAAALSSKNLLLSDQAEIDAQPVLEIHADEVTASHGATVGRLDPAHLFYLRSRGIGEAQARSILTAAFGRQALAPLGNDALVEPLAELLRERLATLEAA
jgi:Fe-S cluster assembly protein SufD